MVVIAKTGNVEMGTEESKQIVRAYFEALRTGDPGLADLFTEDVSWWVPEGSDFAGTHAGKAAVLAFLGSGVGYYSDDDPMTVEIQSIIAEEAKVACEFILEATTASGKAYRNFYHFAFEIEDGRIQRVREYLDTRYAHEAFHGQDGPSEPGLD